MVATLCVDFDLRLFRVFRYTTLLIFHLVKSAHSSLTVSPSNALVVAPEDVSFTCQSQSQMQPYVTWSVHYLHGDTCTLVSGSSVQQCADKGRVSVSHEGSRNTLRIQRVHLSDAGSYICTYSSETVQASLTVLGAAPYGDWNPKSVMAGDEMTMTCRVTYHGSFAPRATWTNNEWGRMSEGIKSRVAGSTNGTLMYLESTLTVPVAVGTVRVEPYTCTIGLSVSYRSSSSSLTWRSDAVVVSYCPHNLAIMSSNESITVGTELTCISKAHPAAAYRWLTLTGSGFMSPVDNRTLTVTSQGDNGDYHFLCIAYNYLSGIGKNPCFASVELQEFNVRSRDESGFLAETVKSSDASVTLASEPSEATLSTATASVSRVELRRERTVRSQQSAVDASYTSSEIQQQKLSQYQTATVVLSVLMSLVIFAVVIIGFAVIRLMRREPHRSPFYQPVERHHSGGSVTLTEMSSLTGGEVDRYTTL